VRVETTFAAILGPLRIVLFAAAVMLAVIFAVDWLVRTRRLNPFGRVARFFRKSVDPLLAPVERRVLRAGGAPSSAPWWALVGVVVGGILVLEILEFLVLQLSVASRAIGGGPRGIFVLLISWALGILQIAILLRVIASWVGLSEYKWWIRWAVVVTEPIFRPIRRLIPPAGMLDLTPLVALLLIWLVRRILGV
jgi:YggT family protein